MSKGHPWFRVYSWITHLPKWADLSLADKGALIVLWCIGNEYDCISGNLPDIKTISKAFGSRYTNRNKDVLALLDKFVDLKWLDRIINPSGSVAYRLHDWKEWQFKSDLSTPRTAKFRAKTVKNDVKNDTHSDSVGVANKEVMITKERNTDVQIHSHFVRMPENDKKISQQALIEGFEDGINQAVINRRRISKKPDAVDDRWPALRRDLPAIWKENRGSHLTSATGASDWSSLARVLKRSVGDPAYSLSAIKLSFIRFLTSSDKYHRMQGFRYWVSNMHLFFNRPASAHSKCSDSITPRQKLLQALQAEHPQALSDEDRQALAGKEVTGSAL